MTKRKRCRKLTNEEKKVVWSKPESNAGCGFGSPERDYRPYQGSMVKKNGVEV